MKWEHRVERINFGGVSRFEKIREQLNALGPEGWEAVAALSSDGNTVGLILKRQISEPPPTHRDSRLQSRHNPRRRIGGNTGRHGGSVYVSSLPSTDEDWQEAIAADTGDAVEP